MRDWRDDAQAELEELRRLLAHANELSGIQPYVIAHISERTPGTLTPDITAWDLISFVRGMLYVISDTDTQSVEDDDPIIQQLWRLDATIPDDGSLK